MPRGQYDRKKIVTESVKSLETESSSDCTAAVVETVKAMMPKEVEEPVIYVRATRVGFYNHVRRYPPEHEHPRAGEVFELRPQDGAHKTGGSGARVPIHLTARMQFSKNWMEEVDQDSAKLALSRQKGIVHKQAIITKPMAHSVI